MIMLILAFIGGMVFHHYLGEKIEGKLAGMLDKLKGLF